MLTLPQKIMYSENFDRFSTICEIFIGEKISELTLFSHVKDKGNFNKCSFKRGEGSKIGKEAKKKQKNLV